MTKTNNMSTNEIIAAILEQNNKLIAILEQGAATVAVHETAQTAKPEKAAKKAAKTELTKTQLRVVNGVINRAAKHGYRLGYYKQGNWVWFMNLDAAQTYKTRGGETRYKETSEQFAALQLSTKSTKLEYSKKRGQFAIKDFFEDDK